MCWPSSPSSQAGSMRAVLKDEEQILCSIPWHKTGPEPWVVLREQSLVPCSRCLLQGSPAIPATVPELSAGTASPMLQPVPWCDPGIAAPQAQQCAELHWRAQHSSHAGTPQQRLCSVCRPPWEALVWLSLWGRGPRASPSPVLQGKSEIVVLNIH